MTIGKNAIEATTSDLRADAGADPDQDQRRDRDLRHALQADEDRHDQPLDQRKADHQRRDREREQHRRDIAAHDAADGCEAVHLDQRPFVDHQPGDVGRRRQQEVRDVKCAGQNLPENEQQNDEQDRARRARSRGASSGRPACPGRSFRRGRGSKCHLVERHCNGSSPTLKAAARMAGIARTDALQGSAALLDCAAQHRGKAAHRCRDFALEQPALSATVSSPEACRARGTP